MPGILPMKMIRVGSNSQSRIAQACDRCRSKKIRCDGIRPCCSQCGNVGFECKTSDKLSRRAFPRGYTESLEDRVRALEAEVRDLKNLLDEKDEKIDMLSRIHNFSPMPRRSSSSPNSQTQVKAEEEGPREDTILVEIPVAVQPTNSSIGTSTTAALIETFEERVHADGRACPPISSTILLKPSHIAGKVSTANNSGPVASIPPRLLSDQYINLFFQEWQPLLPILHRPTFLRLYEEYLADPEARSWQNNKHAIAQLFLIFEISAHSASSRTKPVTTGYEVQWRKALSATSSTPTIATIQSHILAQLCYLLKADYPHLLRHRGYAVSMVHQLYLHQGHKCHSLPVFDAETRKKVFWCQYVLDKFASAATGTPQLLRDTDITADYPLDVDDENISAHGISPSLPGELTKVSSALALFRCSRILGKTLDNLYPARASYQLSLTKLHSLSDELDQWQEELPDHLRLRFCNDKPATNLISCRSPLLSLAYFYVRSLIHRPLLCYGSGNAASAATIVLAAAAKHKLQIIDLLDERSMNYTFPLSKQDVLMNSGISILWQSLGLEEESRLVKDNQKSLILMLGKLSKENQGVSSEFLKIATSFIALPMSRPSTARADADSTNNQVLRPISASSGDKQKFARKQFQAITSRLSSLTNKPSNEDSMRRASMSQPHYTQTKSSNVRAGSTISLVSTKSAPAITTPPLSKPNVSPRMDTSSTINLDYFPLNTEDFETSNNASMLPPKKTASVTHSQPNWEQLANDFDLHSPDMFNTVSPLVVNATISGSGVQSDWSQELWQIAGFDLAPRGNVPQSLLSFSEESLTSAEDLVFSAPSSRNGSTSTNEMGDLSSSRTIEKESYRGITIPVDDEFDFEEIEV